MSSDESPPQQEDQVQARKASLLREGDDSNGHAVVADTPSTAPVDDASSASREDEDDDHGAAGDAQPTGSSSSSSGGGGAVEAETPPESGQQHRDDIMDPVSSANGSADNDDEDEGRDEDDEPEELEELPTPIVKATQPMPVLGVDDGAAAAAAADSAGGQIRDASEPSPPPPPPRDEQAGASSSGGSGFADVTLGSGEREEAPGKRADSPPPPPVPPRERSATASTSASQSHPPTTRPPMPGSPHAPPPSVSLSRSSSQAAAAFQQQQQLHNRKSSVASTATISAPGSASLVSGVLIVASLENIAASKDARRSPELKDAVDKALDALKNPLPPAAPPFSPPVGSSSSLPGGNGAASTAASSPAPTGTVDPLTIFAPLRLACETRSIPLMIAALDSIGKLVSYDFFTDAGAPPSTSTTSNAARDAATAAAAAEVEAGVEDVAPSASTTNLGSLGAGGADEHSSSLADLITTTVCDCFSPSPAASSGSSAASAASAAAGGASGAAGGGATTPHDTLLLRLLSCLLSLILSQSLSVHGSSLLKAVRTVYNVFLMGRPGTVQTVAQATLGQIVGGVFARISIDEVVSSFHAAQADATRITKAMPKTDVDDGSSGAQDKPVVGLGVSIGAAAAEQAEGPSNGSSEVIAEPVTVVVNEADAEAAAAAADGEVETEAEQSESQADKDATTPKTAAATTSRMFDERQSVDGGAYDERTLVDMSKNDLYIKDAFLVFRALCKLSMKPLGAESEKDMKSHASRSKLLSLHLVLSILNNHITLFVNPAVVIRSSASRERTPFIQAVKQYLCLALSRNAVSPVSQVFELSCEIFWRVISAMRARLKKEIEVLLNEIFLPILEMRNSTIRQKSIILAVFARLSQDPQALVDIYLNYDCDRSSLDNIYERLVNVMSKLATSQLGPTTEKISANAAASAAASSPFPSSSSTLAGEAKGSADPALGQEWNVKRQSLECLVYVLRSLVAWAGRGASQTGGGNSAGDMSPAPTPSDRPSSARPSMADDGGRTNGSETDLSSSVAPSTPRPQTPDVNAGGAFAADDPSRFENAKQRKTTLLEGIKKFNFKPKRGIAFLIDTGFIRSRNAKDVARFLLHADGLSKAQIGEFLGEGEPENIATMHAFVDMMDFTGMGFVDALRMFLQSFRLPGEAQKIDRFMLKFAERYTVGNPNAFANADTAYVLAFSVILLNTDAHNPQVKRPMSKVDFYKNNRGIDDGKDLDESLLSGIYDEITSNEIRMKDEVEAAGPATSATGLANAIATVGRDLQREAYVWQSEGMASKTEALFRTMVRGQRRGAKGADRFYVASHFEHVRPMFEVAWMPILAGISHPLQNTDEMDSVMLALGAFKQAIKIACLFDLELERNAFVTTLAKFTFLNNNYGEMRSKNVEAIKALLDIAMVDGNYLKGSWREVLTCVSQLERFQLVAQGVDSLAVPDVGRRSKGTPDKRASRSRKDNRPTDEVAQETRSQHITITADMIFSSSAQLSGTAIVDFVRALSDVSWEEIQVSGLSEHPRTFCLQKLVEISYYNMNRIRLEWSAIWNILGEHFNQVTCHRNANVSFFALDSLRQLAMKFLEKEELPNFKFQKDFLKPFEYAMTHNTHPDARDMVLQCLHQMIQARVQNLRSGWHTMFGVFSAASKVTNERIAVQAFDIVQRVNAEHFSRIVLWGSFADLTVCITDFCKISKYQRASLQAIEMLKEIIPMMLTCPECPLSIPAEQRKLAPNDDPMLRFWFPVLFGFYDVIMNGEDLEVRKRALDYLFGTLKRHGADFPIEFWDQVAKNVLFPIFAVLRSRSDVSRFTTQEDMSVWLSTTMIQALRNLVDLFTFYFDVLAPMLDRLLDLLVECICQENDTLARIGTSCLQQLLESNVQKLSPERWEKIVSTFIQLFKTTTAYQLFDDQLRLPELDNPSANSVPEPQPAAGEFVAPTPLTPAPSASAQDPIAEASSQSSRGPITTAERKRIFRQIIVKCVLQLLLIETTSELLLNEQVYNTIPPSELLRLMASLDESYRFAKRFNEDKDLRMDLWKVGFMRVLPNLLRQESTSASTLVKVLMHMYGDQRPEHLAKRAETLDVFSPLGLDIISGYVSLDPESQARNIAAWTPVVSEVLRGFCLLENDQFNAQLPHLYPLATHLLAREMDADVRENVRAVLVRVGETKLGIA